MRILALFGCGSFVPRRGAAVAGPFRVGLRGRHGKRPEGGRASFSRLLRPASAPSRLPRSTSRLLLSKRHWNDPWQLAKL